MKNIFEQNLNKNSRITSLNKKVGDIGKTKYLPSFSKEWKNTIYAYNKNTLKNTPSNDVNINKIIQSYFNLYFKNQKFTGNNKFILLKRRRNFLRKIYVSNAEIKHTNNKAIITLFTVNREKKALQKKFIKANKKISNRLIKRYYSIYKYIIQTVYNILNKYKDEHLFISDKITKKSFLKSKLNYLKKFITLKNIYEKKIWTEITKQYFKRHFSLLRKTSLLYSLNEYKFNNLKLLPKLSNILGKILEKKIEYNIINLKSIAFHADLFTEALAIKLKKKRLNVLNNMYSILNRLQLPNINTIQERTVIKRNFDQYLNNFKDLKVVSNIESTSLDQLLTTTNNKNKSIHNTIFNSIGYKNMGGMRLEVKGRLTKRYRADRSISMLKWKGGLKNVDSSFKGLSSVMFRGNTQSNLNYSLAKSKRRVGSFAVKGWIGGK